MGYISTKKIQPTGKLDSKVLLILDCPTEGDDLLGEQLSGQQGDILFTALANHNISRDDCRIHYLCNYRPAGNNFGYVEGSSELKEGIDEISKFISSNKNLKVIVILGEKPLQYLLNRNGIHKWRGSIIDSGDRHFLCCLSPNDIIIDSSTYPIFNNDIGKINKVLAGKHSVYNFTRKIDPKGIELIEIVNEINQWPEFTVDIESVRDSSHILCIGFAYKDKAICIVNHTYDGLTFDFQSAVESILKNKAKKIFHNAIFDIQMLRANGLWTENLYWDTMVAQHVLEPELSRSLAYLTSVYTDLPYFKEMGKEAIPENEKSWSNKVDKASLYDYNCMDVLSTYLIFKEQEKEIIGDFKSQFDFEMELLELSMHISESGALIDLDRREAIKVILTRKAQKKQLILNSICGKDVNVKSTKLKDILYGEFKLPVKKKHNGNITTDEDAIVSLIAYAKNELAGARSPEKEFEWMKKFGALKVILEIRGYRQLLSNYIEMTLGSDNRTRSFWNVAATETGRLSSSGFIGGVGGNNQTWPREVLEDD